MLLVDLTEVLIKHLQSFLSNDDIHYFLNSNKRHFTSLKQETIYFSLNKEKSREYVEDERFREMILSKVKDGRKQIGLTFDWNFEVAKIGDIMAHKIYFSNRYPHLLQNISSQNYFLPTNIKVIPFLPMLQDLTLYNCENIQDFSSLSHLKRLELSDADYLIDVTPLQNIPHLTFTRCPNIQNFSVLSSKRQQYLSLSDSEISDVSFLRNFDTVRLRSCNQLINVSSLNGVKNLSIYNCSNIRDISGLGNHHRLVIIDCFAIQCGYECFRSVRHAEVRRLEVPDLSVFRGTKSLEIDIFAPMESQLYFLKGISSLTLHPNSYRKEVCDLSDFRNIRLTYKDDIIKIPDSVLPSQLVHLKLERCDQIMKIINEDKTSIFHHLESLHIRSCLIEHVTGLGDIPTVILVNCLALHDISALGRNRCVELKFCPKIRDIRSLATVPIVSVKDCDGIINLDCLSSVPRLKIVQ